jgi:hypothetical protein
VVRFTDATGLASAVAASALLVLELPGIARLRRRHPALVLAAVAALALAPLGALPAAAYVRGGLGDLSITSMVLLLRGLLRPVFRWGPVGARDGLTVQLLVALGGLVLYPAALGLGRFDPYRWGYGDSGLMIALLLLATAAWFLRLHLATSCLALAVLAHAAGWYESRNLWDYLLDPLVSAWGLSALLLHGVRAAGRARLAVSRRPVDTRLRFP